MSDECALAALPDALLGACLALLSPSERAAASCACSRFARLARSSPAARHVSWAERSACGASWLSDAALRGALSGAAGGALTLDCSGARGFTGAALLAVCTAHGATLRSVSLAAVDDACARSACTGCAAPGSALGAGGAPAGLAPQHLLALAAALPACERLEADVFIDADADGTRDAVLQLASLPCLRPRSITVAAAAAFSADASGLPALVQAARQAGSLRELTLCSVRSAEVAVPPPLLRALALALHVSDGGSAAAPLARLAFIRCTLPGEDAESVAAASALMLAASPRATLAADECSPGDTWAEAVGAALAGGAAPRALSLRALRAGGAAAAAALGRGVAAAAPALRHVTLCCADPRRDAAAALAAALAGAGGPDGLASLDVSPAGCGRSSLALRLPPGLAAARAAGAMARRRADLRGAGDAAAAALVSDLVRRASPEALLLGASTLGRRTAPALAAALATPIGAALAALHITRCRFSSDELDQLLRAALQCPLRELTLVTEARLRGCGGVAAKALLQEGSTPWAESMETLRLHALAYDDAGDDATAWAAVLARPWRLRTLQLSSDVPCGALLALRGLWPGLRLLRGAAGFGVDALTGEVA
jgi:hypothetical protein